MRLSILALTMFFATHSFAQGQPYPPQNPPPNYPPAPPTTNYPPPQQPQGQYAPPQQRQMAYPGYQASPYDMHNGFMAGIGLGFSAISFSCDICEDDNTSTNGLGIDFQLGWFLNPRLALMYDANFWAKSESNPGYDATQITGLQSIAAQYWVMPQFWIKGGLGIATNQVTYSDYDFGEDVTDTNNGAGITLGAGFEIMQSGNFALDISGRINAMSIDFDLPNFDNSTFETQEVDVTGVSLLIGARWK